jgi:hypothetical protein
MPTLLMRLTASMQYPNLAVDVQSFAISMLLARFAGVGM